MSLPPSTEQSAHSVGMARWPDVSLSADRFAAHVRALGIGEQDLDRRAADLYLVIAARAGDSRALGHFEREYLVTASLVAARIDSNHDFLDEVRQQMRVKLLTGEHPRLDNYKATGGLVEWLRVVALRVAINIKNRLQRRESSDDLTELKLLFEAGDVEREAVKGRYLDELRRSLEVSFKELAPRERTLLRLHFVDGLSIDVLGKMYGVHRATVARWLVSIRRTVFERARAALSPCNTIDSRTLRSIYRDLEKDLHITAHRVLRSEAGTPADLTAR